MLCIGTKYEVCMFNAFEIWTVVWRNLNDVTMTLSPMRILSNSNTNLPKGLSKQRTTFHFNRDIGHERAESMEVNKEL